MLQVRMLLMTSYDSVWDGLLMCILVQPQSFYYQVRNITIDIIDFSRYMHYFVNCIIKPRMSHICWENNWLCICNTAWASQATSQFMTRKLFSCPNRNNRAVCLKCNWKFWKFDWSSYFLLLECLMKVNPEKCYFGFWIFVINLCKILFVSFFK